LLPLFDEPLSLAELKEALDPLVTSILLPRYQPPSNPEVTRESLVTLARYVRALESVVHKEALSVPISSLSSEKPDTSKASTVTLIEKVEGHYLDEDTDEIANLAAKFQHAFTISPENRFFGPTSGINLLKRAIDVSESDGASEPGMKPTMARMMKLMRAQYWVIPSVGVGCHSNTQRLTLLVSGIYHLQRARYISNSRSPAL